MSNIQDIYPLTPLQEGMRFHHMLKERGDAYLLKVQFDFAQQTQLERFLAALQQVIDRHDVFRTALHWQGLDAPVQVVLRHAVLPVLHLTASEIGGDAMGYLNRHYDPQHYRLALTQAPLMQAIVAEDATTGRWVLHLLQHHAISDHTTLERMFAEMEAMQSGKSAQLPAPQSFRNFVALARANADQAAQQRFFSDMLADIDAPTAPYGISEIHGDGADTTEHRCELTGKLAQRIHDAARTAQVSTASFMHLAWALVLARLSGRDDVVFGTVLFGRLQGGKAAEQVMGLCINTLPLRVSLGQLGVAESLQQAHQTLSGLLRHEHASLVEAQQCSAIATGAPLFSSLLNYRYSQRVDALFASPVWQGMQVLHFDERTNYPLTLAIDDLGDTFSLTVRGTADAHPAAVINQMCAAVEGLLEALTQQPAQPLAYVNALSRQEHAQLRVLAGDDTTAVATQTLAQLFEAQVRLTPERIAVKCGAASLSYCQLNERANRLAHALRQLGVRADVLVGLCVERSIDTLVGLLAILKAGGAYVPLDPSYPRERLAYLLADAQPAVLLSQQHLAGTLPPLAAPLCMIDDMAALAAWPAENPQTLNSPDDLAYVIYTSGSTGQPKGVAIAQHAVIYLWQALQQTALQALPPASAVTLNASLSFDASVQGWVQLLSGHCVVIVPENIRADGAAMRQFLAQQEITLFDCTPVQLEYLLQAAVPADNAHFPHTVLVGGDAISPALWQQLAERQQTAFYNVYGPTECTVDSTIARIAPQSRPNIGRPLPGCSAWVLDQHGQPVPAGVVGELYLGGAGLARGYHRQDALTATRFANCPAIGAKRLYRSGDLVRWNDAGQLEYFGRNDQQIKLRGYRIEPGEIESALRTLPAVGDAVVLARADDSGESHLVAYLLARDGQSIPEPAVLRGALRLQLPAHMMPAYFMVLEAFPLTPNHKIDRKALPLPNRSDQAAANHVAPRNDIEATLAAIWAEVLKLPQVGIHDNFFALGGHSLSATQVTVKIRERLQAEVPLRVLFEGADIAELAGRIAAQQTASQVTRPATVYEQEEI
jgi:amino acid adenylation domain-containing protein